MGEPAVAAATGTLSWIGVDMQQIQATAEFTIPAVEDHAATSALVSSAPFRPGRALSDSGGQPLSPAIRRGVRAEAAGVAAFFDQELAELSFAG